MMKEDFAHITDIPICPKTLLKGLVWDLKPVIALVLWSLDRHASHD